MLFGRNDDRGQLPSSNLAHCAVVVQTHSGATPADSQLPAWHVSPVVQAFPSSHTALLGLATGRHNPVLRWQVLMEQAVSPTVGQTTTVAGFT